MKPLLAVTLGLACSIFPAIGSAAQPPSNEQTLEKKEAEVLRLRDELKQQERELERLRSENEALRKAKERSAPPRNPTPGATSAEQAPLPTPNPSQPLQQVVPPAPSDTLDASDLLAYFASDPEGAAAKFLHRTFLIRGKAIRLETQMLQRRFWVEFGSPVASNKVRALVVFPADWQGVFAARDGSKLIERNELSSRTILQTGEEVVVRARCQGLRGNEIRFDRGELASSAAP